ncbi:MAG: glycosyltransferase [bacterium]
MPRVLIVTYQWLPMFSVGVKHVANLCRYLPAAGWEPHILTKDWSEGPAPEDAPWGMSEQPIDATPSLRHAAMLPVTLAPYARRDNRWLRSHDRLVASRDETSSRADTIKRRALQLAYPYYGHFPDMHRGWVEPAVAAGLSAIRQYGIGAVVSVCPPATSHVVGGEIARRADIPWVTVFTELGAFHQQHWQTRAITKRWMRGASRASSVSPEMRDYVRDNYGIDGDVVVAPFDPEERRVAPHRAEGAPMRIVHTGSIRANDQQPELLFDALDELVREDPAVLERLTVDLVGSRADAWLGELLADRRCAPIVRLTPTVSPDVAVKMQREADLLLIFNRQDAESGGSLSYPSKLFEHWNASRPTIAVGADQQGFVSHLLAESESGEVAENASALANILRRNLGELRDTGIVAFRGDEGVITRYAAPDQAKRLGALLDAASAERFGSWQRARR